MSKLVDLGFLSDVKLDPIKKEAAVRVHTPKLPVEADLRVFPSGRVYPSEAFAAEYNLEFMPKVVDSSIELEEGQVAEPTVVVGNGLDIFSSKKWAVIAGKLPMELVFIAAVPKSESKVDLWASTKYDAETNTPKASVFTQGASTFSKKFLVPMLAEIYDVNWEGVEYVDLVVVRDQVIADDSGIYHLPKIVSTGKRQGEDTYVRRENITICPLVVSDTVMKEVKEEAAPSNLDEALNDSQEPSTDEVPLAGPGTQGTDNWAAKLGDSTLGQEAATEAVE